MLQRPTRLLLGLAVLGLISLGCGEPPADESGHNGMRGKVDSTSSLLVNCCAKPSCDVCVQKFGKCNCLEDLKAGRPICGECIEGYKHGKGKLKLISIPELKKREGT